MRRVVFGLAMAFSIVGRADAAIQWSMSNGGNDHWYDIVMPESVNDNYSWTAARTAAEQTVLFGSNGYLVTVTSFAEDMFLLDTFGSQIRENAAPGGPINSTYAWIGLTDNEAFGGSEAGNNPNGDWHWVTGEAFAYKNWGPSEPHHSGPNEFDYVHYWDRGSWSWNDDANTGWELANDRNVRYGYIVEFEPAVVPEPASLAVWSVLGVISIGVTYRRRRLNRN